MMKCVGVCGLSATQRRGLYTVLALKWARSRSLLSSTADGADGHCSMTSIGQMIGRDVEGGRGTVIARSSTEAAVYGGEQVRLVGRRVAGSRADFGNLSKIPRAGKCMQRLLVV